VVAQTRETGSFSSWFFYNLGKLHNNISATNSAIMYYTIAVDINNKFEAAYLGRGNTYYKIGDCRKALEDYTQYINLTESPDGYVNRGAAYVCMGYVENAMNDLDRALAITPNYTHALFWRGAIYYNEGSYEAAILEFNKVLQIIPGDRNIYVYRAHSYFGLGEYVKSIDDYSKVLQLN